MEIGKVYVVHNEWIQDPETGEMPYKVGITKKSVDDRYYGLGLKMPGEFICDFAYEFGENYMKVEKMLHNILNQSNLNGEWFNVNEETLEGIKQVCEMAGGKLITEIVEEEIEEVTEDRTNPYLDKIVNLWNEKFDMKAIGRSPRWKSIHIPGINTGVHYNFGLRNTRELNIELGCWTKVYPNMENLLYEFDQLKIKNNIFRHFPFNKERNSGYRGRICTIIPITEVDEAVEIMNSLIEQTKDKVIDVCNKE